MPRSSGRRITPRWLQLLNHLRVARTADVGVSGDAADRLLALVLVPAHQEVGDAFLGDDVGDVVGVDHHRREIELELARQFERIQLLDEERRIAVAKGLADLHHQLAAAAQRGVGIGRCLGASLEPGFARMAAAARIGSHVGRAAKPGDAAGRHRRAVALQVDLERRSDEHVAGIEARGLAEGAIRSQRAVGPGEEDVRARRDVILHADFRSEAVDLVDPAGFDRRNQGRVRIQREVRADLALEAERLAVGRQQQLDRGGVEPDAVIEPAHTVGRVDALDGEHRRQDLGLGDGGGIAGEERLDVERPCRPRPRNARGRRGCRRAAPCRRSQ